MKILNEKNKYELNDRVIMADWFYELTGSKVVRISRPFCLSDRFYTVTNEHNVEWRVHIDAILGLAQEENND